MRRRRAKRIAPQQLAFLKSPYGYGYAPAPYGYAPRYAVGTAIGITTDMLRSGSAGRAEPDHFVVMDSPLNFCALDCPHE